MARLTGSDVTIPFLSLSSSSSTEAAAAAASSSSLTAKKNNGLHINPYTYECLDFENLYALGPLAGDKLVRFLQGGALACAASLLRKYRQMSTSNNNSSRLSFTVSPRVKIVA